MNHLLHGVLRAFSESFACAGPILEIGSYQVEGQEALGDLRMEVGTGHGRAEQHAVDAEIARLAASAACGIARFVLSSTA